MRAAVEAGHGCRDVERIDEHCHALRGPTAGDSEENIVFFQHPYCLDGGLGQFFVFIDKRAVDIGEDETDQDCADSGSVQWTGATTSSLDSGPHDPLG